MYTFIFIIEKIIFVFPPPSDHSCYQSSSLALSFSLSPCLSVRPFRRTGSNYAPTRVSCSQTKRSIPAAANLNGDYVALCFTSIYTMRTSVHAKERTCALRSHFAIAIRCFTVLSTCAHIQRMSLYHSTNCTLHTCHKAFSLDVSTDIST